MKGKRESRDVRRLRKGWRVEEGCRGVKVKR
jgi:hypothetical protein